MPSATTVAVSIDFYLIDSNSTCTSSAVNKPCPVTRTGLFNGRTKASSLDGFAPSVTGSLLSVLLTTATSLVCIFGTTELILQFVKLLYIADSTTKVSHFLPAASPCAKVYFVPATTRCNQMEMVPFAPLAIQARGTCSNKRQCCRGGCCNRYRREPSARIPGGDDDRDLRPMLQVAVGTEL